MADEHGDLSGFTPAERELFAKGSGFRGYSPKDGQPEPETGPSSQGSASSSAATEDVGD